MNIYREKLISALLRIRDKSSGPGAQNVTDNHETDSAYAYEEAPLAILREYPAESLQVILSLLNELVQSTHQPAMDTEAQSGIELQHTNDLWSRFQQALLDMKTEFNSRLVEVESKLQALDSKDAEDSADTLAKTKRQLEELSRQRGELQAKNRELDLEISNLYDAVTFANANRAEIAMSNQPRVDELGRKFASLYSQEVRDLQRIWDEFLVATDSKWDSKGLSVQLKTSIRVAMARMITQYGMVIKTKQLSIWTNEICQAIESLPVDHSAIDHARTLLLGQLNFLAKTNSSITELVSNSEQATADTLQQDTNAAMWLIQDVLRNLGKDELVEKAFGNSLVMTIAQTLETVKEVIKQIYNTGGEVWLAEKSTTFDAEIHERSKTSADDGVISNTEWPGYRVGTKIVKPAIVITESQNESKD